jgi:hypothetical protein
MALLVKQPYLYFAQHATKFTPNWWQYPLSPSNKRSNIVASLVALAKCVSYTCAVKNYCSHVIDFLLFPQIKLLQNAL